MRIIISTIIFLSLAAISFAQESSKTGWNYNEVSNKTFEAEQIKLKKPSKEVRQIMDGMTLIKGGSFTLGTSSYTSARDVDSSLLLSNVPRRVTVASFILNKYEISNGDYKKFTSWVRDSCLRAEIAKNKPEFYKDSTKRTIDFTEEISDADSLAINKFYLPVSERFYKRKEYDSKHCNYRYPDGSILNVYPDTTRWQKDFKHSFNGPMTNHYYWHPAYDDYPVVGISWHQAKAYCDWLSRRLKEALLEQGITEAFPRFRLPTEAEWEYAALANPNPSELDNRKLYPWGSEYIGVHGKKQYISIFMANGGCCHDENGVQLHSYAQDGAFHTSKVASYPANEMGLYDMAGNAGEWVEDAARIISLYKIKGLSSKDDIASVVLTQYPLLNNRANVTDSYHIEKIDLIASQLTHDLEVLEGLNPTNTRIIKGGSWADPPAYLQSASRVASDAGVARCTVGFRVAMILPAQLEDYFSKYFK